MLLCGSLTLFLHYALFYGPQRSRDKTKNYKKKNGTKIIQIISCNFTSILTTYSRVSVIYVTHLVASSGTLSGLIIEACLNRAVPQVFPQTSERNAANRKSKQAKSLSAFPLQRADIICSCRRRLSNGRAPTTSTLHTPYICNSMPVPHTAWSVLRDCFACALRASGP